MSDRLPEITEYSTQDDNIVEPEFSYINSSHDRKGSRAKVQRHEHSPKIVLVEDNELILDLLTATMEKAGYDVYPFADAESAIPMFESQGHEIAVAIIDEILPKLHGHELLKKVAKFIPNTKIILTSGYYGDDSRTPIANQSNITFMHKPYSIRNLMDSVKSFAPLEQAHP